ncbi:MAG: protein kinase [Eubacterium sp.]|nr:protein kinase [Eubacterium sp.]
MNEQVKVPWPGWKITKTLGSGSFGSVYEIQRDVLGTVTKAAMKVISVPRDSADLNELLSIGYDKESINSRFLDDLKEISNEYDMMNKLKGNANIIYCEELLYVKKTEEYGYNLFIRMELLDPIIKSLPNPSGDETVIKLGIDMCNALSACRKHKIIHRDIKPSNILVSSDGNFKLGDFGVSKTSDRTSGGTKTGTYGFMAPEVYNNQPYNASVDIYSLGMVLYWMLNRRCGPFLPLPPTIPKANQIDEAKQRRFGGENLPPPVDGSPALKAIVLKACEFDPSDRFESPEEFLAALSKLRYSESISDSVKVTGTNEASSTDKMYNADENSDDEKTLGNNWGYTDEATQGTQYNNDSMEAGGTVGRTSSPSSTQNVSNGPVSGTKLDVTATIDVTAQEANEGVIKTVAVEGTEHKINIFSGVRDGSRMCLNGKGKTDPVTGAKGNLIIIIRISTEKTKEDFWKNETKGNNEKNYSDEVVITPRIARTGGVVYSVKNQRITIPCIPNGIQDGFLLRTSDG